MTSVEDGNRFGALRPYLMPSSHTYLDRAQKPTCHTSQTAALWSLLNAEFPYLVCTELNAHLPHLTNSVHPKSSPK